MVAVLYRGKTKPSLSEHGQAIRRIHTQIREGKILILSTKISTIRSIPPAATTPIFLGLEKVFTQSHEG